MIEINKTTIGIAAGVAGTLFLGYCIYFDKKRRSDPEYKKKVRERMLSLDCNYEFCKINFQGGVANEGMAMRRRVVCPI